MLTPLHYFKNAARAAAAVRWLDRFRRQDDERWRAEYYDEYLG